MIESWDAFAGRLEAAGVKPPQTLIGVARLVFPELMVKIEATAALTDAKNRRVVNRLSRNGNEASCQPCVRVTIPEVLGEFPAALPFRGIPLKESEC